MSRLRMLEILVARARELGVELHFERRSPTSLSSPTST